MKQLPLVFLIILFITTSLFSQEFPVVGARARAMGGVYVAVADDALATYWNPAGIPLKRVIDINLTYDAKTAQTWDLLTRIEDINNIDITNNPSSAEELAQILEEIQQNDPFLYGGFSWGLFYTNDTFSAGYFEHSITFADTSIDLQNVNASTGASDSVLNNASVLNLQRIKLKEYIFGAGTLLFSQDSYGGVSVRFVNTSTAFDTRSLISDFSDGYNEIDFATEDFSDDAYDDNYLTFDVGSILYLTSTVRVGIVGRNILSPSFEVAEGVSYEMSAQWRAGAYIEITDDIILAGDYDINVNNYFGVGPDIQEVAAGIEFGLFDSVLFLRGGVTHNLAGDYKPWVFSGGLGINVDSVTVDAAMQYAPDRESLSAGIQVHISYRSNM